MRVAPFALALAALAPGPLAASPRAPADDAAKLREQVLEGAFQLDTRLKSARSLEKASPEMLGATLLELAEGRKNPANLPFLVSLALEQETRLLRLLAVYAAWQSDPALAAGAFLDRVAPAGAVSTGGGGAGTTLDDRAAARAVEAAGLVAAVQKDRTAIPRLLEIARGKEVDPPTGGADAKDDDRKEKTYSARTLPGIEAARAVNRMMDKRSMRDLIRCAVETPDNHIRKHLVWAVLDLEGDERGAKKLFEPLRARPGRQGKNAAECGEILADGEAKPFEWNPAALKDVPVLWKTGRPKNLETEVGWKDPSMKQKIQGWYAEMKKEAPSWNHFASSVLNRISLRTVKTFEIFDVKSKSLLIDAAEIAQCETDWQGAYVLARGAGVAMSTILGEPPTGHRGWEPAYLDLYGFMKATKHAVGTPVEFIEENMAKRPWPK
jgi:hypothetical protein